MPDAARDDRQREASATLIDLSGAEQPAQCGSHLEINELGRRNLLMPQAGSCCISPGSVIDEAGDQNAGVSDYHGPRG